MVEITLPDGAKRQYDGSTSGMDIATSISPGLAKKALAVTVNGQAWDLSREITEDSEVAIIVRDKGTEEALEIIRHDCAHVLAEAVQELFPGTQVTIGPNIENGFFYDFYRADPFTTEDLEVIETKMHEIIARDEAFERQVMDRDAAIEFFKAKGEQFKVELIQDLPQGETITLYSQGDWIDLCRGPARADDRQSRQGVQAALRRGRLLAPVTATASSCSASMAPPSKTPSPCAPT